MSIKLTTLCYIENDDSYLMLHRVKKKNDINEGKWIGVGGHFEENETPDECLIREVFEETGLRLVSYKLRGIVTFISKGHDGEYMFLYTANQFTGNLIECDEGNLSWIKKDDIMDLNIWTGDKIFLKLLLKETPVFSLKLQYNGDILECAVLDNKEIVKI